LEKLKEYFSGSYRIRIILGSLFAAVVADGIITKFLVFPSLPKKFDELMLEFDYLFFGDREIRARFYFLRKKPVQN